MKSKHIILVFCTLLLFVFTSKAQEADVYMTFNSWKYSDDSRALIAGLTTDGEEDEIPVAGIAVQYYNVTDSEEVFLGEAVSDEKGHARFSIPENSDLAKDDEFYMHFIARFEGTDEFVGTEEELAVKDTRIDFSFDLIDSVKTIVYNGVIITGDGEEIPLADDDLYFFVPRMFSDLKIGDGWFEEDGTGILEFPLDVIGDAEGNITVIARIEEHPDYGFVEKKHDINWAVPRHAAHLEGPDRTLWTPVAPAWMIITLIIMLVGVWGHYVYAVYQLVMIKKSSKKKS